ncbi:MAG: Holliday junction resolvase RuvX [Pseudomonadota bacterium]|nr:Holliday junction resolvase RuvX [Pseudomonadota bacterium]
MNASVTPYSALPVRGSLLALDHSRAATGIAIASFELGLARPLQVLRQPDEEARLAALGRLIQDWQPVLLVLGLPLDRDGGEQPQSRRVRRFAARLEQRFGLPLVLHDERWSTAAAEADLRVQGAGAARLAREGDAQAAREILQGFLDACTTGRAPHAADPGTAT